MMRSTEGSVQMFVDLLEYSRRSLNLGSTRSSRYFSTTKRLLTCSFKHISLTRVSVLSNLTIAAASVEIVETNVVSFGCKPDAGEW